jgi:hypothetical protein
VPQDLLLWSFLGQANQNGADMGCLPRSGGCEHKRLLPFIRYLNDAEATDYALDVCLDVHVRNSPQPEALYVNSSGGRLVIERKTVVWPLDYAEGHSADHFLVDALTQRLSPLVGDRPCTLDVPARISLSRTILTSFAEDVAGAIASHQQELEEGMELRSVHPARPFRFRFQSANERDEWEPVSGLCISFQSRPSGELIDPGRLPDPMLHQINKIFSSVARKFLSYGADRRVLLIDAHGEARWCTNDWWSEVFKRYPPSSGSMEIWLSPDDAAEGWEGTLFWRVFPSQQPAKADIVPVRLRRDGEDVY